MYNFLELQKASTGKATFVSKSKKELHANVRKFLIDSVKAYANSNSHKLDAKVGLRVALDYSNAYALQMRSALSKVNGAVNWSYDKSGKTAYKKCDIAKDPAPVKEVIETLNAALDKLDAENVKEPRTDEQKLASAAKSANTMLINAPHEKLIQMGEAAKELPSDDFANYLEALNTLLAQAQSQVQISLAA